MYPKGYNKKKCSRLLRMCAVKHRRSSRRKTKAKYCRHVKRSCIRQKSRVRSRSRSRS